MSEPGSARVLEAVGIASNGHVARVVDLPRAAATRLAPCCQQQSPTAVVCPPARPPALPQFSRTEPATTYIGYALEVVATMTTEHIFNTHLVTLNAKDMEGMSMALYEQLPLLRGLTNLPLGKWLGPVPIEKWLNDFRPTNRKQRRERRILFNTIKTTVNGETNFVRPVYS